MTHTPTTADDWSDWLLQRRHAADPTTQQLFQAEVEQYRQRVLDGARLEPGMTLADIGTGEGLIALGAIARIGPTLRVILTDVSAPLLRHTEELATARGVRQQCTFLQAPADKLDGIASASVNVVTTRAVLAYVADKPAALGEFHRILLPGGRISLAEPINQDVAFETAALAKLIAAQPTRPDIEYLRLLHRWQAAQYPATEAEIWRNPLTNCSERDLFALVRQTRFRDIHLELHIDTRPTLTTSWQTFLAMSPHPWAPTLAEILATRFSTPERQLLENIVRPKIEANQWPATNTVAYLTAVKSSA